MATHKTVRLEYIKWVDAIGGNSAWTEITKIKKDVVMEVYSAGYVFDETEDYVLLVPHWHPPADVTGETSEDGFGDIAIPKVAILERKVLKTIKY